MASDFIEPTPALLATTRRELLPVGPQERIPTLDILRGLAMFGVLWSNLNDHYGVTAPSSGLQHALSWTQNWMIESRFSSFLGFLFGIGFAIQLTRAEQRGVDVRAMFCRRMLALLGIGVVHGLLIWSGDVLTEYALLGMILMFYRRLSPRGLLLAAAATLVLVPYTISMAIPVLGLTFPQPAPQQQVGWTYAHGTFAQIAAQGAAGYLRWYRRWPLFAFPPFLALFVLGLWAVRVDLLNRLMARRRPLLWVLVASVAGTLLFAYIAGQLPKWWPRPQSRPELGSALFYVVRWRSVLFRLVGDLGTWSNAAAYASSLALLASIPAFARRLEPLAAVGRMSLTTYLTQSLISVAIFYHYGFGWYGRVGYDGMFAITAIVFVFQMVVSMWWLRRYRFGPMEWLWRSIAYGNLQHMQPKSEFESAAAASPT